MKTIYLIIIVLAMVDGFSDMYSPVLPYIAAKFSLDNFYAQITITAYLIGLAISSLLYGYLSDIYGRRIIFIIGLFIFFISSVSCSLSNSFLFFIISRFVQGLGAGCASTIGYASINDVYKGNDLFKSISKINMVSMLAPALAPILGSKMLVFYGFDYILHLITIISFIVLILFIFCFKETINFSEIKSTKVFFTPFFSLFYNYKFILPCLIQAFTFGWVWTSITNTPFIFINELGVPVDQYSYYIFVLCASYFCGTILNQFFVAKVGYKIMLGIGLVTPIISNIFIIAANNYFELNPIEITLIWIAPNIALALILNNSIGSSLDNLETNMKAKGSALLTFSQLSFGALFVQIVSYFYNGTIVPSSLNELVCSIISVILFIIFIKKDNSNDKSKINQ